MDLSPAPIGRSLDPYREGLPVALDPSCRRKHLCVCGATGAGKSRLITSVVAADVEAGHGVTVIDPHGELVAGFLANHIPKSRSEDVIVLDAKDQARALSINILDTPRPDQKALVVSNAMNIFETLWRESLGPRMLDILRNALFVLIEQPFPTSLAVLPTFLTDADFRRRMLGRIRDPIVLDFFHNTYDRWANSFREEAISPVLNKVRAFLTNPLLRGIVGKAPSSFSFRRAMDERKIILCDLSKGAIGADNARLLGSLIVMQEKLAASPASGHPGGRPRAASSLCRRGTQFLRRCGVYFGGDPQIQFDIDAHRAELRPIERGSAKRCLYECRIARELPGIERRRRTLEQRVRPRRASDLAPGT